MKVQDVNEKQAKPIDSRLMNGPLSDRHCTDIICCLLFIASFIFMWYIAITGYSLGKPERILAAYDSDGNACDLDLPDYPLLFFPIIHPDYYNKTVCVERCPANTSDSVKCQINKNITSCPRDCTKVSVDTSATFDFTSIDSMKNYVETITSEASNPENWICLYGSQPIFSRACFPSTALEILNQTSNFSSSIDLNRLTSWLYDLSIAKYIILASFFIAFGLGMIYMLILRFLGGIFVWLTILLYFVGISVLAGYTWDQHLYYVNDSQQSASASSTNAADNAKALEYLFYIEIAWIIFSIIAFICIFNKIRLAIGVVKTATLYVKDNFSVMIVPPIIGICLGILWVWWIVSVVYIVGLGDIKGDGSTPFATVTFDNTTRNMVYYFMFGGLWKQAFLLALNQFIIGCSVCIWYFNQGPGQSYTGNLFQSIYWAFRYHLGSLAFGSFILAVVQFIRLMLEYAKYQAKKMSGDNKCTKCILDCLSCLVACFERFIEFLNKNAYIQIALTSKSFCPAAKDAFESIWANTMRYSLVSGIGAIFTFIGKLFVGFATVLFSYEIFINVEPYKTELASPVVPSIVCFIIAYMVAILFMSIYSMACDAVLTCFIYDEELNKQNGGMSAQHCPETLREWFDSTQTS
ncbi:unnamed protein product [Paramecium sonneborni]|uniref:Choline transporter-like protein n=1 Tax=Paramecium sonneborni TaxID=65129 RepID=A0A8S1QX68_9CILI|nr:unnamed protein product [Paramecium sonneborni]